MHRGKSPLTARYSPCETDYGLRMPIMARTHNGLHAARIGWMQWCGVHRWAAIGIAGGRSAPINYHQYASYAFQRPVHATATTDGIQQDHQWRNNTPYARYYLMSYWIRWQIPPIHQLTQNHLGQTISIPDVDLRNYVPRYSQWGHVPAIQWWRDWVSNWTPQSNIDERISHLPANALIRALRDPNHPLYYRIVNEFSDTYLCGDRTELNAYIDTWRRATPQDIYAGWASPTPGATRGLFSHSGIILVKRKAFSSFSRNSNGEVRLDSNGVPILNENPSQTMHTEWIQYYHPVGWDPNNPTANAQKFWVDDDGDLVPWVVWCLDEVVDPSRLDSNGRPETIRIDFELQFLDWGWSSGKVFRTIFPLGKNLGPSWTDAIRVEPDARTRAIARRFTNRILQQLASIPAGEESPNPILGAEGDDIRLPLGTNGHPKREIPSMHSWIFNFDIHLPTIYGAGLTDDDRVRRLRTLRHADGTLDWTLVNQRIYSFMWDNMGNILTHYPVHPVTQRPNGSAPPTPDASMRTSQENVFRKAIWHNHHALLLKQINHYLSVAGVPPIRWDFNCFSVPEVNELFPDFWGFNSVSERQAYLWSPAKGDPRNGQTGQAWFANNGNTASTPAQFLHWLQSLCAFNVWFVLGYLQCITYEHAPFYYINESGLRAGDPRDNRSQQLMGALLAGHGLIVDDTPRNFWHFARTHENFLKTRLLLGIGIEAVHWRFPEIETAGRRAQARLKRSALYRLAQLFSNMPDDLPLLNFVETIATLHGRSTSYYPTAWINEWLTAAPGLNINTTLGWRNRIALLEQHTAGVLVSTRRPYYYSPQQQLTRLKPFVVWHPHSPYQGNYNPRFALNMNTIANHNPGIPAVPTTTLSS